NKFSILRIKNVGYIGRYAQSSVANYTFQDLVELVAHQLGKSPNDILRFKNVLGYEEENSVLFPVREEVSHSSVWVKSTYWNPSGSELPDPKSTRRGRLTQNFKIAPFFEHVKANEFGY